ncbi:hypothetical protein [Arcticibacterium luteifluviistationis]|uniref:T9SS C-terminal target domain-containing protein n=1 Tax=Arcticibacterium luteifluviistationis TaxID=1784714 RepID=A0A2Z4GD34_9BACT|nr:hypothetical protein [Arcticibacterium luteifluviistationis]AWV98935.1 hypothetical protein DJ013_12430 [Arcticibacterium luteifluviistationis]
MLKYQLALFYFAFKIATCSCNPEKVKGLENYRSQSKISKIGKLDIQVDESSGLARAENDTYWTNNDSGGSNKLFKINKTGNVIDSLEVLQSQNKDWEELAKDDKGNIYIGDFGNNGNSRKDLIIYKVNNQTTEEIRFQYQDQINFPASKKNFDCEAFFWFKGQLHLFSKSREENNKVTKHYMLPDAAGNYTISPENEFPLEQQVTAADISPDQQTFILLTYGKLLFFGIENETIDFKNPLACIKTKRKQTEAVIFDSNESILFTNEQRELFQIKLDHKVVLNN